MFSTNTRTKSAKLWIAGQIDCWQSWGSALMADISDHIPANAIRFDEALKRLVDADARTAEVRAELDRLYEAKVTDGPQWADAWNKWEDIEREVADFFHEELRCGAVHAYRRDRHTGQDLRVPVEEWKDVEIVAGDYKTCPPVYFLKVKFEARLAKASGRRGRGRPPNQRKKAKDILLAVFGTVKPPEDITDDALWEAVIDHCIGFLSTR